SFQPNEPNDHRDLSPPMDPTEHHHHRCPALHGARQIHSASPSNGHSTNDHSTNDHSTDDDGAGARLSYQHNGLAADSVHTGNSEKKGPASRPSSDGDVVLSPEERAKMLQMIRTFMSTIGEGYYTFPWFKFFKTKLY
ncbi:unnamed protein product, partial [Lymnaea stagnalis]